MCNGRDQARFFAVASSTHCWHLLIYFLWRGERGHGLRSKMNRKDEDGRYALSLSSRNDSVCPLSYFHRARQDSRRGISTLPYYGLQAIAHLWLAEWSDAFEYGQYPGSSSLCHSVYARPEQKSIGDNSDTWLSAVSCHHPLVCNVQISEYLESVFPRFYWPSLQAQNKLVETSIPVHAQRHFLNTVWHQLPCPIAKPYILLSSVSLMSRGWEMTTWCIWVGQANTINLLTGTKILFCCLR